MPQLAPAETDDYPITPSAMDWLAMSQKERDAHIQRVWDAAEREQIQVGESVRHFKAKTGAYNTLNEHFRRVETHIYVAAELSTLYPGERAFTPDLLAVRDVEASDDDDRSAWIVAEEGRGLDLVLEVLVKGDKQKDLVRNVARYARLGIPEYFVYDRGAQKLYGYRLAGAAYRSLPVRQGLIHSDVLGLSLGALDGRLRFYYGDAQIPEAAEVLERLERLVDQREREIAEVESLAATQASAREEAERRLAEAERLRGEAEARAESEAAARAALEAELADLRARLRSGG